ncbi:MAG: hypothetical protein IJW20_01265 [Clostridia bacterium]|nr:hypothetical protein [Clostridia bacterium]
MKKIISSVLIIVLLFNFIFCKNFVYAEGTDPDQDEQSAENPYDQEAQTSNTVVSDLIESGAVSQTQGSATKKTLDWGSAGVSAIGQVLGLLARLINIFIVQVDVIMGLLTVTEEGGQSEFWLTIDRIVFNRIALFNINYFDTEDTYNVGELEVTSNASNIAIKEGITTVYYMCRLLATIILLLVLIYIGIRMALSTVASDQAKYKKMLMSWIESLIYVFVMAYIMVLIIEFGELLTGIFYDIRCQLLDAQTGTAKDLFEDTIRSKTLDLVFSFEGLQLVIWSIVYWVLLFTEMKFFWLYLKRLLMIGLLIIISPLITVTYSIDKVGDGKAQVFSSWLKEFIVNVLIQPLHALLYLIFVFTANSIATYSPIVAVALLMVVGSAERMVKVVFDMKGLTSLRGINKFMKKEG